MVPTSARHPLLILAIALIALPWLIVASGYTWGIATEVAIFAMVGLGFNLLLGYTGLLSFGHGLFFGLAAYCTALTQIHWFPNSALLPLACGVVLAVGLGLLVGFLALRRRGVYFSLLTLAFTALTFYVVFRWTSLTGGENGLSGLARKSVPGIDVSNDRVFYYIVAGIVFGAAWLMWRVVHSPLGSVLVAIRENEQRTRFAGYPVMRYKLVAFVLSAAVTGLGGSLFAYLKLFISADLVNPTFSGEILAMTILGGMGNFLGPALGALFYLMFREVVSSITPAWQFWFGLLFMAFILYSPLGLVGLGERLLAPLRRKREEAAAMAARVTPQPGQEAPAFLREYPALAAGALIVCTGVRKRFGGFTAVDGVDLEVQDRRLHALIGPNGAGKTTLFNIVSGMFAPDAGSVQLARSPIEGLTPEAVTARGLARSFQITSLFPSLCVWEHLRLGVQARAPQRLHPLRRADSLAEVNAQTRELVRFLGLEGVEQVAVSNLSYGGQRLVEIGVALAAKPRALLLDEPLVGLAAAERERITQLIRSLTQHMAVLLVEHDIDRVFAIADRITVMNEGRVLVEGDAETVRANAEVQRVYIGGGRHVAGAEARPAHAAGAVLLGLSGVNTFYGKSHILHDVAFEVRENEVVALLGRNGAGKSSTFKTILGIAPPRSGTVTFAGETIGGKTPEQIARLGVGLVPQGRRLFAGLTVEENLKLGRLARTRGSGVRWDRERIFSCFPRIRDKLQTKADQLSGGEQQMVAIARALSGNVKILLLDEPFEGLSPVMVDEVFRSLEQLRREISILVIEHHLDIVLSVADRAVVLDRGRVSHEGPAQPLLTDLEFRRKVLWL